MLSRTIINTFKQIKRSGWVGGSSVAIMTLAFVVASIFGGLAYLSNLYINLIESRDNMVVFFEIGYPLEKIENYQDKWGQIAEVNEINFLSEEEAYYKYLVELQYSSPVDYELVKDWNDKRIVSSLDIRLSSLSNLEQVRDEINRDITQELSEVTYDPEEPPIQLITDDERLDELRQVFGFIRAAGMGILVALFVIIFFFTLMTVEFRTYNRMEEIGVMQLVGGSLGYIRAPYILEGAFYGIVGAIFSSLLLALFVFFALFADPNSPLPEFVFERIAVLDLPQIEWWGWLIILGMKVSIAAFIGSLSSYLAIRRYIK